MHKFIAILSIVFFVQPNIVAQSDSVDTDEHFFIGTDLVSSYIWRGSSLVSSPCIQPSASAMYQNFSLEIWGSNSFNGGWFETDVSLMYENSNLRIGFTDYYFTDDLGVGNYFIYYPSNSNHIIEASAEFKGTENIPFRLMAASYILGSDLDPNDNRRYSTYLEAGWMFSSGKTEGEVKFGFTPAESVYAAGAAWIQAAIRLDREIKISNSFELPIFSEFVINPYLGDAFFFVGLSLGS